MNLSFDKPIRLIDSLQNSITSRKHIRHNNIQKIESIEKLSSQTSQKISLNTLQGLSNSMNISFNSLKTKISVHSPKSPNTPNITHQHGFNFMRFSSTPSSKTSKTSKAFLKIQPKPNLPIPIGAISSQSSLKESTRTRLINMLTETDSTGLVSVRSKTVSSPRKRKTHQEYIIPPSGAGLDLVLKQIKEKERVLRQENEFWDKIRDLTVKIEKKIYPKEEDKKDIRIKKIKKSNENSPERVIETESYVLPSKIIIKPQLA
ncbi:unnamed protein product [Blepharisma stoltei]|uniref:Uncharacterized protein n=1 Tax=Blepharisma stoltei TaxID=1481888 RepID=A0AAU9J7V8_9CILI|nr:unnamed protein product [Blepharisma stoltei]